MKVWEFIYASGVTFEWEGHTVESTLKKVYADAKRCGDVLDGEWKIVGYKPVTEWDGDVWDAPLLISCPGRRYTVQTDDTKAFKYALWHASHAA